MSKLIIVISGKKGAGKNTLANLMAAAWLNARETTNNTGWTVDVAGVLCSFEKLKSERDRELYPTSLEHGIGNESFISKSGLRILSFASPLKEFCMKVLSLTSAQCYGSDEEKRSLTGVRWNGLPLRVRFKYRKRWFHKPLQGFMTAREVMQVFGTDVIRTWHSSAWAIAAYKMASEAAEDIVIIPDCRFPNEDYLKYSATATVKTIRLQRAVFPEDKHPSETAMDNYPFWNFDAILSADATVYQMQSDCIPMFNRWVKNYCNQ